MELSILQQINNHKTTISDELIFEREKSESIQNAISIKNYLESNFSAGIWNYSFTILTFGVTLVQQNRYKSSLWHKYNYTKLAFKYIISDKYD